MPLRILTLFVLSIVSGLFLAGLLEVGRFDILVFAVVLAPFAVLSMCHKGVEDVYNPQSIIFTKYHVRFRLLTKILWIIFIYGIYKYFLIYGVWKTIIVFLIATIIQGPLYAFLKLRLGMEVLLYPIIVVALTLFYYILL